MKNISEWTTTEKSHLLSAEKRIFQSLTGSEHEDDYFKIGGDTSVPFHSLGTELQENNTQAQFKIFKKELHLPSPFAKTGNLFWPDFL